MGEFTKTQLNIEVGGGGLPKKSGAWTVCRWGGEGGAGEKEVGVFKFGGLIPQYTLPCIIWY